MRPATLDRWSRGSSAIHRRDPRAKLIALLVFLVVVATAQRALPALAASLFVLLCAAVIFARIPLVGVLARAAIVLPFSLVFGAACWLAGDPGRAVSLLLKSYLSALAVLLVVATTPLPDLLSAGRPRFLVTIAQFLYRYLFVIMDEARIMNRAAQSRGARFGAAAGALAALFARSYQRAEDIHRAMIARGFSGRAPTLNCLRFSRVDVVFAGVSSIVLIAVRVVIERLT